MAVTYFTSKQTSEDYPVEFDFTEVLTQVSEVISVISVTATDMDDDSDVTSTLLIAGSQTNNDYKVFPWVQAGTSGKNYLITVQVTGDGGSDFELDAVLPVQDIPDTGVESGGGIVTEPTIEPITLDELKAQVRLDSGSFSDNVTESQSIVPGSKAVADNYTTHAGTGVEVIGKSTIVYLNSGANGASGTVDVKIQESDDDSTYVDWSTGAFTQVTEDNDNAIQEKEYTGTKRYIRTVAKVLVAACVFGTTIVTKENITTEDDLLNDIIESARGLVEDITRRWLLTQTWDYTIDAWPKTNYIKLPGGNLQSISSVKWKDTDGDETTLVSGTDYLVETNGEDCGRIVLPYAETWPNDTLYPSNPITIRYVAGWTTAANIPSQIRSAVKLIAADMYVNREGSLLTTYAGQKYEENPTVMRLLNSYRLWDEII